MIVDLNFITAEAHTLSNEYVLSSVKARTYASTSLWSQCNDTTSIV